MRYNHNERGELINTPIDKRIYIEGLDKNNDELEAKNDEKLLEIGKLKEMLRSSSRTEVYVEETQGEIIFGKLAVFFIAFFLGFYTSELIFYIKDSSNCQKEEHFRDDKKMPQKLFRADD
jgi:hypothetical protein